MAGEHTQSLSRILKLGGGGAVGLKVEVPPPISQVDRTLIHNFGVQIIFITNSCSFPFSFRLYILETEVLLDLFQARLWRRGL